MYINVPVDRQQDHSPPEASFCKIEAKFHAFCPNDCGQRGAAMENALTGM